MSRPSAISTAFRHCARERMLCTPCRRGRQTAALRRRAGIPTPVFRRRYSDAGIPTIVSAGAFGFTPPK